jgi:hypothetical protein
MKVRELLKVYSRIDSLVQLGNLNGYSLRICQRDELAENDLEKEVLTFDVLGNAIKIIIKEANNESKKNDVPPLGIMPKCIWDSKRRIELIGAMNRYAAADKKIPEEWIDELLKLNAAIAKQNEKRG